MTTPHQSAIKAAAASIYGACQTVVTGADRVKQVVNPTCPTHATYTASEVKVLTETASKVAYALGRKDAGEEIAAAADEIAESHADAARKHRAVGSDEYETIARIHRAQASGAWEVAREARGIASQPAQAASDAISGVPGHQEVSEAVRSPQEPCGDPTCPCAQEAL